MLYTEDNKSILNTVKKMLGMPPDYSPYDVDLIVDINAVFATLNQIGIGPPDGFQIEDSSTCWDEYEEDSKIVNMVKPYMAMSVRLMFDPPISATTYESIKSEIAKYENRMYTMKGGY